MTGQPGLGVMLQHLGAGSNATDWEKLKGRTIASIAVDQDHGEDGALVIAFRDGSKAVISDRGRSCCESRYLSADGDTNEDFAHYIDAELVDFEVRDAPDQEDEYGEVHEVCFLEVKTSLGSFTLSAHNEHNGYYGGFAIGCTVTEATEAQS